MVVIVLDVNKNSIYEQQISIFPSVCVWIWASQDGNIKFREVVLVYFRFNKGYYSVVDLMSDSHETLVKALGK